jgi:hypothetical protein
MAIAVGAWKGLVVRAICALLLVVGLVLAAINAVYLPAVIHYHDGEWPVFVFHVGVILAGLGLAAIGLRFWPGASKSAG